MKEKKLSLEFVLQTTMSIVTNLQYRVDKDEITQKRAKKLATVSIQNIRYGKDKSDYIWGNDVYPRMIIHPSKKLIGADLSNFKDKAGQKIFVNMAKVAKSHGKGFIQYVWNDKVEKDKFVPKLSYVLYNEKWGWILGTGIYINDVNATIKSILISNVIKVVVVMYILIGGVGFVVKKNIREPLLNIASQLYNSSESFTDGATRSLENCDLLSNSSQNQASSLQQTVSSVEQISAMISRNAESADQSKQTSLDSQKSVQVGKMRVDEMLKTIDVIASNNDNVIDRMK
jgi:methyl-accepting chemotaxis protein